MSIRLLSARAGLAGVAVLLLIGSASTYAQHGAGTAGTLQPVDPPAATAPSAPATAPSAAGEQPIRFRVIEVNGDVLYGPADGDAKTPCKLNDEYPADTKILTGIRASIKLQVGEEEPYTCLLIESSGKTYLSEAYKTQESKNVRIGVGYGRIRAGVAEGGLKSSFTVDSPVATLSKRGTWGFTMYYERDTDAFEIGLTDRGLVEAINQVTGQRRTVPPKQLVTQAMRRWLDESAVRNNIPVADFLGQSDVDIAFNQLRSSGLGVISPGQGREVLINLNSSSARDEFSRQVEQVLPPPVAPIVDNSNRFRPEGFFGTGRGEDLIVILIDANNPLAQQGLARPGRYVFPRRVVENFLRGNQP